jgi:ATP-dependent DNA ligase
MIAPMLCHSNGPTLDGYADSGWVMEPKLDGWRWQVTIWRGNDRITSIGGRNGTDYSGKTPEIEEALSYLPGGTVLDGELIVLGGASTDVPNRLAHGTGLVFMAFDVLMVAGHDAKRNTWRQRRQVLDELMTLIPVEFRSVVAAVPGVPVDQAIFDHWIEQGWEGAVVKDPESAYYPGIRTRAWVKVKPSQTMDATVIGWKYGGGGGNAHQCGALHIHLENGVETTCKYDCTPEEADLMVGRLIEIQHFGVQRSGSVRHPTFLRLREDMETNEWGVTGDTVRIYPDPETVRIDVDVVPTKKEKAVKKTSKPPTPREPGTWVRNYSAMGDAKLLGAIESLRKGEGPAVERVEANQGDVAVNLEAALNQARSRGWSI